MSAATTTFAPRLKRSLGLGSLVLYKIILIQPTAPMPQFGVAYENAGGHVVTLILIGKVAMLFTALICGRMANVYPNDGSAYASRGFHASPGCLTGGVGRCISATFRERGLSCAMVSARPVSMNNLPATDWERYAREAPLFRPKSISPA